MSKKKKYRGHYCWICGEIRPNEKFSGSGHKNHICKKCTGKPKEKIQRIKDEQFIYGILDQKNISKNNIEELDKIANKYRDDLGKAAETIAKIGRLHPRKKKRIGFLYNKQRAIFDDLVKLDFIEDYITPMIEAGERSENELEEWMNSFDHEEYEFKNQYGNIPFEELPY
jgi:hypothetical protein